MKKWILFLFTVLLLFRPGICLAESRGFILLASTIGPIDSGVVSLLEDAFEKETGIRVRHVGAGTGAALDIARKGQVDLVMVHAKSLEEKFIREGYGTERVPLMYNDFVIVGPAEDPAGIRGLKTAAEALKIISQRNGLFISRGDKSGTHVAEMELWGKAGVKPAGTWYRIFENGTEGNAPTLRYTDTVKAYTVIDRASYLSLKGQIKLAILVEGDEALLNYISLIPVSDSKFPNINVADSRTFIRWLTAPDKGQTLIRDFGKDRYGGPLFFPNAEAWHKQQK